jgi:DNA-binding NtrC family response regulator
MDDEKEIRAFLNKALSRLGGFHVELAESGEEALRKLEKEPFELVLTDLKMPKMDGLQLIAEIGKSKPETLTIMMTGHGTIDFALEAMKRGASNYLMNPLRLDELMTRILDEELNRLNDCTRNRSKILKENGPPKDLGGASQEVSKWA